MPWPTRMPWKAQHQVMNTKAKALLLRLQLLLFQTYSNHSRRKRWHHIVKTPFVKSSLTHPAFPPLSPTCFGWGCMGSSFSKEAHTSLSFSLELVGPNLPGESQSSWAGRHCYESVSWFVHRTFSRWESLGTPQQGGVQKATWSDARAISSGSSGCGGEAARLWAPPAWPSFSPLKKKNGSFLQKTYH